MRILVTGGSGLVGRALVAELAGDHQMVVLSRTPQRVEGLPDEVTVGAWDGVDVDRLTEQIDGADAVVHLAGENIGQGRWTAARKRLLVDSRVRSSAAVAAACRLAARPPETLLQASAIGIYGPRGGEEVTEEMPPGGDFLADLCRRWEAASAAVEAAGVRRVVLRTGVVLARDGGALPRMVLPFRLFLGGPLGTGCQVLSWIHLGDLVGAIRFLLEKADTRGVFHLTAPEPVTQAEFANALGRRLHRPSSLPTPAMMLRLALGEQAVIALEGQRVVPRRLLAAGYRFRWPDLPAALADLLP